MKKVWSHSSCSACWKDLNPNREPVRLKDPEKDICCICAQTHSSGIIIRRDPDDPILICTHMENTIEYNITDSLTSTMEDLMRKMLGLSYAIGKGDQKIMKEVASLVADYSARLERIVHSIREIRKDPPKEE
jgi:hypothetical protein